MSLLDTGRTVGVDGLLVGLEVIIRHGDIHASITDTDGMYAYGPSESIEGYHALCHEQETSIIGRIFILDVNERRIVPFVILAEVVVKRRSELIL